MKFLYLYLRGYIDWSYCEGREFESNPGDLPWICFGRRTLEYTEYKSVYGSTKLNSLYQKQNLTLIKYDIISESAEMILGNELMTVCIAYIDSDSVKQIIHIHTCVISCHSPCKLFFIALFLIPHFGQTGDKINTRTFAKSKPFNLNPGYRTLGNSDRNITNQSLRKRSNPTV